MTDVDVERLAPLLEPAVAAEGCELVDIERAGAGRNTVLRLYIDREGGVTVEDCARVSRQVELVLEAEEAIEGSYTLEVSSPGLTRPLKKLKDYRMAVGKLALLRLRRPVGSRASGKITGLIRAAGEKAVTLEIRETGERLEIPYTDIARANLEIEL